jgi:hypothetical protein
MASLAREAGFSADDESLSYVLEQAISKGSFSAVDNRS